MINHVESTARIKYDAPTYRMTIEITNKIFGTALLHNPNITITELHIDDNATFFHNITVPLHNLKYITLIGMASKRPNILSSLSMLRNCTHLTNLMLMNRVG